MPPPPRLHDELTVSVGVSLLVMLLALYAMAEIVDAHFLKSLDVIAHWLKLPPSVAGATLLAFGTSAPEISTALVALFAEGAHPGTGIGSIVGSAIFQILVVIGFAAMVRSSTLSWRPLLRDSVFYAISIVMLAVFVEDGRFTLLEAASLVGTYLLYLLLMLWWARRAGEAMAAPTGDDPPATGLAQTRRWSRIQGIIMKPARLLLAFVPDVERHPRWTVPVFLMSLGGIGFCCYWLVLAAEAFAIQVGIEATIVALTVLAGGTSLPEVLASAIVSRQGRGDMAIANALGSNIFDILVSLGLPVLIYCAMYGDLTTVGDANVGASIILLFATLTMVVVLIAMQRFRVGRFFGGFLIVLYGAYVWLAYAGHIEQVHDFFLPPRAPA